MQLGLGQRIELLKKVARTLSKQSWADMDLILRQADLPTDDRFEGEEYRYCVDMMQRADNETLLALDDYLHSPSDASADDAPWTTDDLKLFISHINGQRAYAAELCDRLAWYGIEGFVAHIHVKPNKEWQQVIEAALRSCDACVALLHSGFRDSDWCEQEIGFVLGRNVPVVPVSVDLQPYGFFGRIQSLPAGHQRASDVASPLARTLLRDPRTGAALTDRMVHALIQARSFDNANRISDMLKTDAPSITGAQLDMMHEARKLNTQVSGAYSVEGNIKAIEDKFGLARSSWGSTPATYDPSEEPF